MLIYHRLDPEELHHGNSNLNAIESFMQAYAFHMYLKYHLQSDNRII